jgi:hypothetical protein
VAIIDTAFFVAMPYQPEPKIGVPVRLLEIIKFEIVYKLSYRGY